MEGGQGCHESGARRRASWIQRTTWTMLACASAGQREPISPVEDNPPGTWPARTGVNPTYLGRMPLTLSEAPTAARILLLFVNPA